MKFYRVSGGIERIWVGNKDTGKITLDAKALASKGLTYADAMALRPVLADAWSHSLMRHPPVRAKVRRSPVSSRPPASMLSLERNR